MPTSEFIAKYNDPVFHQIKASFNNRSDDYPVLMLPVRLETKFMEYSRIKVTGAIGRVNVHRIVEDVYDLIYKIRTWNPEGKNLSKVKLVSQLSKFKKETEGIRKNVNKLKEVSRIERLVLRDGAGDLLTETDSIKLSQNNTSLKSKLEEEIDLLQKAIERVKSPSRPVYEKGKKYLAALDKLNKSIDAIFISNKVNAKTLDKELGKIENQVEEVMSLADSEDFRATHTMIEKMKSKISYIKRQHKSGNVRLTNFINGYTGNKDLKAEEYKLRKTINNLQKTIEKEHVPIAKVKENLKTYPITLLSSKIVKLQTFLRAKNKLGYKTFSSVSEVQKSLFIQIKDIHTKSQIPLEGTSKESEILKKSYSNLKTEIIKFQKSIGKISLIDRRQKLTLSSITKKLNSYLAEMKELEPGVKSINSQLISSAKIRNSTLAAMKTKNSILSARDSLIKVNPRVSSIKTTASTKTKNQQVLEKLKKELTDLQTKIKVSASNTSILPRAEFNQLKSAYFSLRDQVNNILAANPLPQAEDTKKETDILLGKIENQFLDQLTDINNPKDRFFDAHRGKITFAVPTEDVKELWVRIYPDDIAIDNHDERLTDDEETIARDFYYEVYSKASELRKDVKLGAWRAAATSLGVRRAAYAIRILEPKEVKDGKIETIKNDFAGYLEKNLGYRKKNLSSLNKKELLEKHTANFEAAPSEIKKLLKPKNFTLCIENKSTLDDAIGYFRSLIDNLSDLNKKKSNREQKLQRETLAKLINECGKIVYQFYKTNIIALNEPFRPKLTFPEIEKKTKSWDRAGITEALPDRFVVITKLKSSSNYCHVVTGKSIQKPLPVSIDPSGDQAERFKHLPNGDLEIPEEINWMFDFDSAVEAGMAVRIPLSEGEFDSKFELVMAYGVQDRDAEESQELINKLFTNHLYSEGGMEYLPIGTATNNTDEVKSPYRALDNDLDGAFDVFFADESPNYLNSASASNELLITDGQFFKEAMGLPNDIADFIRNHEKKDIVHGRAMNRALYNATLKYYFKVMVDNLFITDTDVKETLIFLLHHVSGVGTLPVFRVDNQPYGVLPITPTKFFKAQGSTAKGTEGSYIKNLTLFLKQTRAAFEHFDEKPFHISSPEYESDPQGEFLKILGLEPHAKEFFYRFGINAGNRWKEPTGDDDLGFTVNWDHSIDPFSPSSVAANYDFLLKNLGHTTTNTKTNAIDKSPIYRNRFTEGNFILGNLVQDERLSDEALSDTDKGKNYIKWLHDFSPKSGLINLKIEDLPKVTIDGEEQIQHTLLMAMLRGALVYDHSSYALKALDILSNLDVKTLEKHLSSHVDLASYRLDAWLTGLADYRLKELRSSNKQGTYLGAYGFVHDLERRKDIEMTDKLPAGLEPTNGRGVRMMADNQGFIHGQSMNHAVTAAVLRAGYNSNKGKGDNENALAVNLNSKRVRIALSLLEGVGNGQETGALLGYMFERALHEKYQDGNGNPLELDVFIYRLRRKFPSYSDSDVDPTNTAQSEAIRATNVVDGLAMIDHFEKELTKQGAYDSDKTFVDNIIDSSGAQLKFKGFPWGLSDQLPNPAGQASTALANLERKKIRAIIHELDNMADALDALGDLVTSEGVYQLVRGNHVRAGAVLNSLSEGKVPLDPEIIRSMRQGVMVTQRAFVQIPNSANTSSPWLGVPMSPKSKAEPALNSWLATKIGNPEKVAWKVKFGNTETSMSLADLNLQPIDLVLLITAGGDDSQNELQARCINYVRTQGAETSDDIEILFNELASAGDFSFGEIISLIQHLGKVVGASRAADARDYRISEDEANFGPTAAGIDTAELMTRLNEAVSGYNTLYSSLSAFEASKTSYTDAEKTVALEALEGLSQWGFTGFYPTNKEEDVLSLAQRILSAKSKMEQDLGFAEEKLAALELEVDQGKWVSFLADFGVKFFGSGFKMLPKITLSNFGELSGQLAIPHAQGPLRNHPESYLTDWTTGISLVRNRLSSLDTAFFLEEVLHGNQTDLRPIQLPFDTSLAPNSRDYWLGAPFPQEYHPEGDRLSLLVYGSPHLESSTSALLLDEWMEVIPDKMETTGIAFHFNQPDSRAPQSLLLAVPPEKTGKWDFEILGLCVEEAFSMAKLRAVEPDHIDSSMFSQLLPATATLAFGDDEFARRLSEGIGNATNGPTDDDSTDDDQVLGYYIDYTSVNHGRNPENS